jgi:hypothetical protein
MNNIVKILMKILGEGAIEIVPELFTISRIKNLIKANGAGAGANAAKDDKKSGKSEKSDDEDAKKGEAPDIKFSGLFDLTDEVAYATLLAKLDGEVSLAHVAPTINHFINTSLPKEQQKRRFRVVVGNLGKLELTRTTYFETKSTIGFNNAHDANAEPKLNKTVSTVNLGIEFLKSFANEANDEARVEVCKAIGIYNGMSEKFIEGLNHAFEDAKAGCEKIKAGLDKLDAHVTDPVTGAFRTDTGAGRTMARVDNNVNRLAGFLKNFGKRP